MKRTSTLALCSLVGFAAFAALLACADGLNPGRGLEMELVKPVSARALGSASISTRSVTLPTYPFHDCLLPAQPGVAGVPYQAMNWTCMITAGLPVSKTYTQLVLSNDYLTVTMLPELGGRVYEMIFRATGHNELYRNPVLKPTPWGPLEQGWWLAVGGIEWGFPTEEHGYLWGVPWHYRIQNGNDGVTVTVQDSVVITRPAISVDVHLPANRAVLELSPRIINPTAASADVKYWTNAMLAPGEPNSLTADLRFLFPGDQVLVHSSDDPDLPAPGELMDWPWYNGRDYGRLGNWDQWLGFFEAPQAHGPFVGIYDTAADEGIVRVYPEDVALGSKAYAHGWSDPLPPFLWTDDQSAYVEVHGGLERTFWDTATLASGQVVSWTETWYPVAGIGGVSTASKDAAVRLERGDGSLLIGLFTPASEANVDLQLWRRDYTAVGTWQILQVSPVDPFVRTVPDPGAPIADLVLVALAEDGDLLAAFPSEDRILPLASVDPLPSFFTVPTFTVSWRGADLFTGIDGYDVQYREGYAGEWVDWLAGSSSTSAEFSGADGQTYFFRTRARDSAGNVGVYGSDEWGQASTSVLVNPAPVLMGSRKLAHPLMPGMPQTVSYTILISNTGSLTATGLALTDHLPATLDLVSGTLSAGHYDPSDPSGSVITWQGMLPPGQGVRLRYALEATAATLTGIPLTNTVHLKADGLAPLERSVIIEYHRIYYLPLLAKNALLQSGG